MRLQEAFLVWWIRDHVSLQTYSINQLLSLSLGRFHSWKVTQTGELRYRQKTICSGRTLNYTSSHLFTTCNNEAVDTGNCCARICFVDFSKGFGIIDQNIFLQELCFLNVDQTLYVQITAFLTNRTQALRVVSSLSPWRHTHGGVPQGTKLEFTLSTTMINRPLGDLHSRLKYVDGTTDFEVIPRNSSIACWILLLEIFNNYSSSPSGLLTQRP